APETPPLGLHTIPLSAHAVEYPAMPAAHLASSLETPDQVRAWRGPTPPPALQPPTGPLVPLTPLPGPSAPPDPIDRVILRRGSTREFPRAPIGATTGPPARARPPRRVPAARLGPPG